MASILSVDEMGNRREASLDSRGQRRYTRVFVVITDDPCITSGDVGNAGGLPLMFDPLIVPNNLAADQFFTDAGARVTEIRPREDSENPYRWEVEIHYDSNCPDADQGTPDPLDRAPIYAWDNEVVEEPVVIDLDNNRIMNSAATPFNPPPTRPVAYDVLTITRYERDYPANAADFAFATNVDTFMGYDPGLARMDPIKAVPVQENAEDLFKVTYTIRFRGPSGFIDAATGGDFSPWNFIPLDHGPKVLKNGKAVAAKDGYGSGIDVLLDGRGNKIDDPTPDDAVYLQFRTCKEAIYATLNLE
jgi:hypothetical protein